MPGLGSQRFAGLALMVACLLGCQRLGKDLAVQIEEIVVPASATLLALEDLSEPHVQRKRWPVQIPGSWSDYRAAVARGLSEKGFRVEALETSLNARKTTEGDSYHIDIRLTPPEDLGAEPIAQVDFTGTPF